MSAISVFHHLGQTYGKYGVKNFWYDMTNTSLYVKCYLVYLFRITYNSLLSSFYFRTLDVPTN